MRITLEPTRSGIKAELILDPHDMPKFGTRTKILDPGQLDKDGAANLYIRSEASMMVDQAIRPWRGGIVDAVAEALMEEVRTRIWGEAPREAPREAETAAEATEVAATILTTPTDPLSPPILAGGPQVNDGKSVGE